MVCDQKLKWPRVIPDLRSVYLDVKKSLSIHRKFNIATDHLTIGKKSERDHLSKTNSPFFPGDQLAFVKVFAGVHLHPPCVPTKDPLPNPPVWNLHPDELAAAPDERPPSRNVESSSTSLGQPLHTAAWSERLQGFVRVPQPPPPKKRRFTETKTHRNVHGFVWCFLNSRSILTIGEMFSHRIHWIHFNCATRSFLSRNISR